MSSQILITGATGFIGRQLTHDLMAKGHQVRILARSRRKATALFGDSIEITVGDLGNKELIEEACVGIETIYHVAGIYRFGLRHRRELWRVNVEGTESVLSSAAAAGVGKVIHLSSGGVLKKRGRGEAISSLLDETDFPENAPRLCPYKASKWQAEKRVLAWVQRGLNAVIASTTCPIGRGDETPTPTGQMIRDFIEGHFPFYCRTGLNFIGVEDLSVGLQQAALHGRSGERYLLTHENLWLKEFLDLLAAETGLPAPQWCLPKELIRLIGCGGEILDFLNSGEATARICLETALQADCVQFFSNAKARAKLGWEPALSIPQIVRQSVQWFRGDKEITVPTAAAVPMESQHVR